MCFLCGNSITIEQHNIVLRRIAELENELRSQIDDNALLRIDVMDYQTKIRELEPEDSDNEDDDGYYHASDVGAPSVFSVLSTVISQTTLSNPFTDVEEYEEKVQDAIERIDCNRIKEIVHKLRKQKTNDSVAEITYTVKVTNLTTHEIDTLKKLTEGSFVDDIKTTDNEMDIVVEGERIHLMYSFGAFGDNVDQLELELSYYVQHVDDPINWNYARTLLEKLSSHTLFARWSELESKRK